MKTCEKHNIVFEEYKMGRRQSCPVCEAEAEIARHEETNEALRTRLQESQKQLQLCNIDNYQVVAENAALKETIEAVGKWADKQQADRVKKLREIIGWE